MNELTPHWMDDITILYKNKNYLDFLPRKSMSHNEILNAVTRFSIYLIIILALLRETNTFLIYIPLLIILVSIVFYFIDKYTVIKINKSSSFLTEIRPRVRSTCDKLPKVRFGESLPHKKVEMCRKPNKENPFMNVLLSDYINDPNRPPACDIDEEVIENEILDGFYENLYRNAGDVFEKENSQRTYYTMPSTTIPNDRDAFANWLYKLPETCKENGYACPTRNHDDLRQESRREFVLN